MISRRSLLQMGAAAASSALVPNLAHSQSTSSLVQAAKTAGQNRVVIVMGGGAFGKQMTDLFFDPFTKETGIEVVRVDSSESISRLKAMTQMNIIEWDIIGMGNELALSSDVKTYLDELGNNCDALPNVRAEGIDGSCFGVGVLWDSGGAVLTYDERAFPEGGPANWAEFWDVERFPGPRSLPNHSAPWEVLVPAVLADGVPREKVFPLDLDRAFAKLDQLRPHIGVWWTSGDQSQQLLRSQEVVASILWSGRAARLKNEGVPIQFTWDGAPFTADVYSLIKGAPHPLAAKALLDFMYTRPEAHAAFIKEMFYATPNKRAQEHLDPAFASTLVTAPENFSKVIKFDPDWLASHRDEVIKRWTAWIGG
ncbi:MULTISPECIES: extracellular solute-binding protein [unclassified Sinorhizobium]|uniref:ABC transporter substrate-binding protein n=1 Tax=unclassified Sinorhizobium TaxID=2613772 RepID=UPI0024C43E7F|nr:MULTISPECIES: extracellular solute-binding protein [unclassified Sinorhizobium]MDK1378280.1 extracellular solute-binding protein [Sinorhizobium sp. 6-70]MDK1483064.1 extracellular solute-binding protein [Sinorhizobium sp. 6-117]